MPTMEDIETKRRLINEVCLKNLIMALEDYIFVSNLEHSDFNDLLMRVYGKTMANNMDSHKIRERIKSFLDISPNQVKEVAP